VTTVCQIYHEPTSTILFDFNDPTAANVGSNRYLKTTLFQKVDLGIPAVEFDRFAPKSAPGGYTTFHREGFRTVSIPFTMRAASTVDLSWAMAQLNTHIIGGCVIRWRMDGATDYKFIDVEPSQPSYYIDGRELALHDAATMMETVEGVTVQLTAQANLRGAAQAASANLFTNSTLTRDSDDDGDPDVWAWVSTANITNQTISASGEAHQFDIATAAVRTMTEATAAASASVGQVWSCSFYARVTSSTMTNVQAQAVITWRTSAPADISTSSGTLVTLTPGFQRITLTATAPATTDRMVAGLQLDPTSATSATVQWKNAAIELAAAPTPFTVATETVSMDPAATGMAEYLPVYNPGDAWSPCEFVITAPDASTALTDIYMSRKSSMGQPGRALTDFLNGPFKAQAESSLNGWTVTLGTNVTATAVGADASGTGNDVARINHATNPTDYSKKITWTRTTDLDSLRGEHDVWVRVKAVAAEVFTMQLRWGPGDSTPVPYTLDEVTHDASGASSFGFVMVKLGRIRLPKEPQASVGTLKLELWTHVGTADQDLDVDYLDFMPAEAQVHITAPTEGGSVTWLGSELVSPVTNPGGGTAGLFSSTTCGFTDLTDNAGSPPAAGSITEPGRHTVTFHTKRYGGTSGQTLTYRIRNITDSANTATTVITMTAAEDAANAMNRTTKVKFDAVAGKVYQAQVDDPSSVTFLWDIFSIKDSFIPTVGQNEKVRTDPGIVPSRAAVEKLNSSSALLGNMDATGVPFWIPPGLSLIGFEALDASITGYEEPQSFNARTLTVQANVTPMFHGP
jgi:hypothetical protein